MIRKFLCKNCNYKYESFNEIQLYCPYCDIDFCSDSNCLYCNTHCIEIIELDPLAAARMQDLIDNPPQPTDKLKKAMKRNKCP